MTGSHWDPSIIKPEVWIDFHHTITTECGACPDRESGELCAGDVQEGVREAFEMFTKMGIKIVIYTGYGTFINDQERASNEIKEWLKEHDLDRFVSSVRSDKPTWFLFIDDRSLWHRDWSTTIEEFIQRYENDIGDVKIE